MLRLVSLNVEINRHREVIAEFLRKEQPDVFCLQECLEEDVSFFASILGYASVYKHHMYIPDRPDYFKEAARKHYGVALFAKEFISSGYEFYTGKEEYTNRPFDEYLNKENNLDSRVYVYGHVAKDGQTYRVCTTHFPVTESGSNDEGQLRVANALITHLKKYEDVILCGDFNAPRGKETFTLLSQAYKDCIPPHYTTSIDGTLHRAGHLPYMVDGLFLSPHYEAHHVELISGVSDHMAIVASIEKAIQD